MRLISCILCLILLFSGWSSSSAQSAIPVIETIDLDEIPAFQIKKYWLKILDNGLSQPVCVPVLIARGNTDGPVLGLTAAIHGNELNGLRVIQEVFENLDVENFNGTIIAIPGLNAVSIPLHQRRYPDSEDLNRKFPGKANGNDSQQYVWHINQKILSQLDYLIDMHTASFGRENSLYVRADMSDKRIAQMAYLQDADIILSSKGKPSTGNQSSSTRTMRAEAMLQGIAAITVEYGNPQVFQPDMIERGQRGVENIMSWLKMINEPATETAPAVVCEKSYWIYVEEGGYLEIKVNLGQLLKRGALIAVLRNPFGDIIKNYYCPEDGIVIGRSSNPVNQSGGRIIHLGILADRD